MDMSMNMNVGYEESYAYKIHGPRFDDDFPSSYPTFLRLRKSSVI